MDTLEVRTSLVPTTTPVPTSTKMKKSSTELRIENENCNKDDNVDKKGTPKIGTASTPPAVSTIRTPSISDNVAISHYASGAANTG